MFRVKAKGLKLNHTCIFFIFPPIMSSYMPGDETKYTVLSQLNYSAGNPVSVVLFFLCVCYFCVIDALFVQLILNQSVKKVLILQKNWK